MDHRWPCPLEEYEKTYPCKGGYRRRLQSHFRVSRRGQGSAFVQPLLPPRRGQAVFLPDGTLPGERYGPVHGALAHPPAAQDPWLIVSNTVTGLPTVQASGLRFDSEANCWDDKSTGLPGEDSTRRSAAALERVFCGIATAPL